MDKILGSLKEGYSGNANYVEVSEDTDAKMKEYLKGNFPEAYTTTKNKLDEYFRLIKTADGGADVDVVVRYHDKDADKIIYFNQHVQKSRLFEKIGPNEELTLHIGGDNYAEVSNNLGRLLQNESEEIENGFDSLIVKVKNELGMHVRPSAMISNEASKYKSDIYARNGKDPYMAIIEIKGKKYTDAKSIMSLMSLAAAKGSELEFIAKGEDSKTALKSLSDIVNSGFGEA